MDDPIEVVRTQKSSSNFLAQFDSSDKVIISTMLCLTSVFFEILAKPHCRIQIELFKHNPDNSISLIPFSQMKPVL